MLYQDEPQKKKRGRPRKSEVGSPKKLVKKKVCL